jgi:hypothetical protein
MTVRVDDDGAIRLEGACRVEEAETLTALLRAGRGPVDLSACESLHAAVVQALLAFAPALRGAPSNGFLRDHLVPALAAAANAGSPATSAGPDAMEDIGPPARGREGEGAQV